jgi:hypothetical protein
MFTTPKTFLKFFSTGSVLTLAAACAQPQPVPIVADMYFDKFSAAQSAGNGVDFCELNVDDFTPELVAQIRSNPNYERNLAIWLEECPELALAFADFGTASIATPATAGDGGSFGQFDGTLPDDPEPTSTPEPEPAPPPPPPTEEPPSKEPPSKEPPTTDPDKDITEGPTGSPCGCASRELFDFETLTAIA